MLYMLAIETGLRQNELRSIACNCLDLHSDCPTVYVSGEHTKNSESAAIPLRQETARDLQGFIVGKLPAASVFGLPSKDG